MTDHRLYQLRGVEQRYAGRLVLSIAELDIIEAETLALVGPFESDAPFARALGL